MRHIKTKLTLLAFLAVITAIPAAMALSKEMDFKYFTIDEISRYREDRIAFQHVEHYTGPFVDNSAEYLMVIRDRKIYLLTDGYDDLQNVVAQRNFMDMEKKVYDADVQKNDEAFWVNKIKGILNRVVITDRKVEILSSNDEKFIDERFGKFYKNIRESFLKKHVAIFKQLMANRKDSGLYIERKNIPKEFTISTPPGLPTKFYTKVTAKTSDGRVYYAEDIDGDDVTETFTVTLTDGFNWGYKSGPNMIFIYDNKQEDLKTIMGDLTHSAYFGTEEEKGEIEKRVKSEETKIIKLIDDLVKEEKFYK